MGKQSHEGSSMNELHDDISTTKTNGIKITLVVDEFHVGLIGKNKNSESLSIPSLFQISLLEMSATPLNNHVDVEVDPEDVTQRRND